MRKNKDWPAGKMSRFHPCYDEKAHGIYGRIHLAVAPKCNISCNFCERRVSEYYHTSRPGVAHRIIKPADAVSLVGEALTEEPMLRVAAVSGPGDALYNPATFRTLSQVHKGYPKLKLCICTNGLLLPSKINALKKAGVSFVTVTVNAVDPDIGMMINRFVKYRGKTYAGRKAAEILLKNQLEGISLAIKNGMVVKVNTVLIPGVNIGHVEDIARTLRRLGVKLMNIMPLIPCGRLRRLRKPSCDELMDARKRCERHVPQFRACRQCRADACGIPGREGKHAAGKNRIQL